MTVSADPSAVVPPRGSAGAGPRGRRIERAADRRAGITLIELLVVMAIVAVMMAVAYPNVTSGLEGIRVRSAASEAGAFWATARQRADRFQEVVQVTVDPKASALRAVSAAGGWSATLAVPSGLFVALPVERRSWLLYPGTPSPEFALLLEGEQGAHAGVKVHVLTGVPEEWDGPEQER